MADWFAGKSGLDVLVPDVFEGASSSSRLLVLTNLS